MNSKSLIHITLTKIFEKYEKDNIQREKNKNYTLLNKTFSYDDIKNNKRIKCCEYEDNSNLSCKEEDRKDLKRLFGEDK